MAVLFPKPRQRLFEIGCAFAVSGDSDGEDQNQRNARALAIGLATLDRFADQAQANRLAGAQRRDAIQSVLTREPDLSAKQVQARLPTTLALRTVQGHMRTLRQKNAQKMRGQDQDQAGARQRS